MIPRAAGLEFGVLGGLRSLLGLQVKAREVEVLKGPRCFGIAASGGCGSNGRRVFEVLGLRLFWGGWGGFVLTVQGTTSGSK